MASKVVKKRMETGSFAFGHVFIFLFASVISFLCILSLTGCNGQEASVAGADQVRNVPLDARKAEVLKSLDRKFENPQAHFELGQIYQAEGLTQKAEYHYNVALSFDPAHVQAQAAMVKLFLSSGDTAKGKTYAKSYIDLVSDSVIQSLRLATAFEKEQLDEHALACLEQALRKAPDSAIVNKELGFYYLARDDQEKAKEYFVRSFQLDPSQPEVAGELGKLGVEVRIPTRPGEMEGGTAPSNENDDREWRIVAKHGLIQVEPIVQKGEKDKK